MKLTYYFNLVLFFTVLATSFLVAEAATPNNPWFANNTQQNIGLYSYGPSPSSEDSQSIFDSARDPFWNTVTQTLGGLELHILLLDNKGVFNVNNSDVLNDVPLSDSHLNRVKWLQENKHSRITVSSGSGLDKFCNITNDAEELAKMAVAEEMEIFDRLFKKGIIINEYNIDGPFLRLLEGSYKIGSCGKNGIGLSPTYTAAAVAFYLQELQAETIKRQGVAPALNLVINLPNYRVGDNLEMHWGTTPKKNIVSLDRMYDEINKNPYPNIATVVIDYPYSYIKSGINTKASASGTYTNCQSNTPCSLVSADEAFRAKVIGISALNKQLHGAPNLSFYLNTSAVGQQNVDATNGGSGLTPCALAKGKTISGVNWQAVMKVPFVPYKHNRCFAGTWPFGDVDANGVSDTRSVVTSSSLKNSTIDTKAEADMDQERRDKNYFLEVNRYYNLVTKGLPTEVRVDNLYFHSWNVNPRYNSVHAVKVHNLLDQNGV